MTKGPAGNRADAPKGLPLTKGVRSAGFTGPSSLTLLSSGFLAALLVAGPVLSCAPVGPHPTPRTQVAEVDGLDPRDRDLSAPIATNFYQYANGGWLKTHPATPERPVIRRVGSCEPELLQILEDLAATPGLQGDARLLADFYSSGMDTATVEKLGLQPFQDLLRGIGSAEKPEQLALQVGKLHGVGVRPYFRIGVTSRPDDAAKEMIVELHQADLVLPRQDYLSPKPTPRLDAYREHLEKMFLLLGDPPASARVNAQHTLQVESALARAALSEREVRDPRGTYRLLLLEQMADLMPQWDWRDYFEGLGIAQPGQLSLTSLAYFQALARELSQDPARQRAYLRWSLLRDLGDVLPQAFLAERAAFRAAMMGSAPDSTRASQVTRLLNQKLGMPLGRLYCERFLSDAAREQALVVVRAVKAAMETEILSDWVGVSQAERDRALQKLRNMRMQVGFPDSWPETPNVIIRPDAFAANVMALNRQALLSRLAQAGKPAPEPDWPVPPQTSNAVYSATDNALTLPAGMLRPPFFSQRYDDALNFGGLGSIAGHEMGHAFDRVGQQFDALGRLTTSPLQLPRALSEDASGLQADECLADRLGLKAAYRAFAASGSGPGVRGGYTAEQRFFLSYARVWAASTTADFERWRQERGAPHPRPQERVNQAVKSLPEFRQAFPEAYENSSAQ